MKTDLGAALFLPGTCCPTQTASPTAKSDLDLQPALFGARLERRVSSFCVTADRLALNLLHAITSVLLAISCAYSSLE